MASSISPTAKAAASGKLSGNLSSKLGINFGGKTTTRITGRVAGRVAEKVANQAASNAKAAAAVGHVVAVKKHPAAEISSFLAHNSHLPPMTVRLQNDNSKYRFEAAVDIYMEPSLVTAQIEQEFVKKKQHRENMTESHQNKTLHMFRSVQGKWKKRCGFHFFYREVVN
jgi:hypothetical protein